MAEYKTDAQVNYGWGLSLNMTGKAPAIAKRIFRTKADAQAFVDDAKDSAIAGLQLSVIEDGANNGIYFVSKIGTAEGEPGVLEKVGGSSTSGETQAIQEELNKTQQGAGLKDDGSYSANTSANYINNATSLVDADNKLDAQIKINTDAIAAETQARTQKDSELEESISSLTSDLAKQKVTAKDSSIEVLTTGTTTEIKVKIKPDNNALKLDEANGLYVDSSAIGGNYTGSNAITVEDNTISLKLNSNDKILSQTTDGLLATISLSYDDDSKLIKLIGKDSADLGSIDATNFIKDGMLQNVELVVLSEGPETNPDGLADGTYLKFTFNVDVEEGTKVIYVNVTSLIDIYQAGDGLSLSGKTFAIKIASDSQKKYLSVSAEGLKISGIDEAIAVETDRAKAAEDKIEASVGLNEDGSHQTPTGNYTSGATTIVGEISALDTQVKKNADEIASIKTISTNAITSVTFNEITASVSSNVATIKATSENVKIDDNYGSLNPGTTAVAAQDTISTAFKKVEKRISEITGGGGDTNLLHNVTAGNGIEASEVSNYTQTISIKLDTQKNSNDNALELSQNGIYLSNNWDCGTYSEE